MESEKILVAAGLTAAAVVGAFVFWGPATHSGRGRGRLAGLVNLGQTCFLNAVLHALAACSQFVTWLQLDSSTKDTSLRATLSTVLSVINGTHKSVQETSYAPAAVINALKRLGWVIPAGEQDAHELLNVILTILDDEIQKLSRKAGCLSDALGICELGSPEVESESPEFDSMGSVMSLNDLCRPSSLSWRGGANHRYRWISRSCKSLQLAGPPQPLSHPFSGTLTSQLRCTECGFKSAVRYDKFGSLSLALPSGMGDLGWGRHKLHQLLTNFVTPEVVLDVQCEGCNDGRDPALPQIQSKQIKILNFGKLYTSTSEGGSPLSNSMPSAWGAGSLSDKAAEWRNVYQLCAVVVHSGDAHSGHFITYRRGHQNTKWYYTSDVEIREATIEEVLQSTAYMLFYEKSTNFGAF